MSHPCVRYLENDSPARRIFSGDQLLLEHLPAGTRCIYPKPPMEGLKDPKAAIRYAVNHPENSDPLHALLKPGMKVTIAFDDVSLPLPPMKRPDIRQMIMEVVLEILGDHGVDDIHLIAAPVGLCGYKALKAHHNPKTMRKCHSYMDPEASELHNSVNRQGRLLQKEVKVFTVETAINNRMYGAQTDFLAKIEDDLTDFEWGKLKLMKKTLDALPQRARQEVFYKAPAPYEMIGVWAGETEAVHKKTLEKCWEQYAVPVKGR